MSDAGTRHEIILTSAVPTFLYFACATALISSFAGCARHEPNRILAGPPPSGTHSVFVVGRRYHTGLVVRSRDVPQDAWPARRDFPDADYLELGWGEREYYPHDDPGIALALRALFTPSRSTINVVPISGPLSRDIEIIELHISQAGFARMVEFIRRSHELDADGRAIVVNAGPHQQGRFYASPLTFHAFENCNVWVARALHAAGLQVDPRAALTAAMLLRQARALSTVPPAPRE